jgi:hypothetical protein
MHIWEQLETAKDAAGLLYSRLSCHLFLTSSLGALKRAAIAWKGCCTSLLAGNAEVCRHSSMAVQPFIKLMHTLLPSVSIILQVQS